MWAGRLGPAGGQAARRFTASIGFDRRLYREDLAGSRAHARMLARVGLLTEEEADAILRGLDRIEAEIAAGTFPFREEYEDIHLNVERRLAELVGPVAGKLHTARSRNDQVALDMHLFVKRAAGEVVAAIRRLQAALLEQAEAAGAAVAPGYTHLQHAQPILFAHHLLAYFFMLERDKGRLRDAARRADVSPLGAAALAGTSHPIDPAWVAATLGLAGTYDNSVDAVSDRDFVLELVAALALFMVHASRLGEELVLWASREFGFIEPDDAYATGSSIMPQKKNPDVAELARGKAGRVFGDLMALLTVMKGLPLAYHSDMQEDKEACFDAVDTALAVAEALAGMVATMRLRPDRMAAALVGDFSGATDAADALVRQGVPFREAHQAVGALVRACLAEGRQPWELGPEELAAVHPALTPEVVAAMAPEAAVAARRSPGGTAPERVAEALRRARAVLEAEETGGGVG
jgi:argininosuccinate lyase